MSYEPTLDGRAQTNVYGEHVYRIRATFGAASAVTFRSKDATIEKTTTTTFTIRLPKAYAEVTDFNVGRYAAASVAGLEYILTDLSALATTGVVVVTSIVTAGTATAPAVGDVIYITLGVSCDTLNDKFTG